MRLPISWTSSIADWLHVPAVWSATGTKICETDRAPYLAVLLADALLPAAPASVAVWLVRLGVGVRDCYILRHWFALVPTVAVWCHSVVCHPAAAKS